MTTSNRREETTEEVLNEYIKDVEETAEQVRQIIKIIQENQLEFVKSKTEITFLIDSVKELSSIIKDGSLMTRLALVERELEQIKSYLIDIKAYIEQDTKSDSEVATRLALLEQQLENLITKKPDTKKDNGPEGKWKLYVTIATGTFTILGTIIAVLLESGC